MQRRTISRPWSGLLVPGRATLLERGGLQHHLGQSHHRRPFSKDTFNMNPTRTYLEKTTRSKEVSPFCLNHKVTVTFLPGVGVWPSWARRKQRCNLRAQSGCGPLSGHIWARVVGASKERCFSPRGPQDSVTYRCFEWEACTISDLEGANLAEGDRLVVVPDGTDCLTSGGNPTRQDGAESTPKKGRTKKMATWQWGFLLGEGVVPVQFVALDFGCIEVKLICVGVLSQISAGYSRGIGKGG